MLARLEQLSLDKNEVLKRSIIRNESLYYSPFCSEFMKAKMQIKHYSSQKKGYKKVPIESF